MTITTLYRNASEHSNYGWQAWDYALTQAGMPRTADSGQFALTSGSNASTSPTPLTGYEVRSWNDYHIRLDITGMSAHQWTVGTGSDGSGNITGKLWKTQARMGIREDGGSSSGSGTLNQVKVIYDTNNITCVFWATVQGESAGIYGELGFSLGKVTVGSTVTPCLFTWPYQTTEYLTTYKKWVEGSSECYTNQQTGSQSFLNCQWNTWIPHGVAVDPPIPDTYPVYPVTCFRTDWQSVKVPWLRLTHRNAPILTEDQKVTIGDNKYSIISPKRLCGLVGNVDNLTTSNTSKTTYNNSIITPNLKLLVRVE